MFFYVYEEEKKILECYLFYRFKMIKDKDLKGFILKVILECILRRIWNGYFILDYWILVSI